MLITTHKARRPAWQDTRPPSKEHRQAYAIAAKRTPAFARAFRDVARSLLSDDVLDAIELALNENLSSRAAVEAVPLFDPADREAQPFKRFREQLARATTTVIGEAGKAVDEAGLVRKRDPAVSQDPIRQAESQAYIEQRTGNLIAGISTAQRDAVRLIVSEGIEAGLNPRALKAQLRNAVGLTPRQVTQLQNRRAFLASQGLSGAKLDKATTRVQGQLLNRRAEVIARTEMIDAESEGRNQAWKSAQREGLIDETIERIWISAVGSPRTCPTCIDLEGKTAPIDGAYDSIEGPIDRPPAHPQCRCTESIQEIPEL